MLKFSYENEVKKTNKIVCKCTGGECNGFVMSDDMKCSSCDRLICKSCHEIKGDGSGSSGTPHVCNEDIKENIKFIKSSNTKMCPKCSVFILVV